MIICTLPLLVACMRGSGQILSWTRTIWLKNPSYQVPPFRATRSRQPVHDNLCTVFIHSNKGRHGVGVFSERPFFVTIILPEDQRCSAHFSCRDCLVRKGGGLESLWCSAPREFKSLSRRFQRDGVSRCGDTFALCPFRTLPNDNLDRFFTRCDMPDMLPPLTPLKTIITWIVSLRDAAG